MTDFRGICLLMILTSLIYCCGCEESMTFIMQTLSQFDRKLLDNKKEILGIEEKVLNFIEVSKTTFTAELKENIREQMREAMVETLLGDALHDMVKSEIFIEMRHLRRGYHQLKRKMRHFSKSLKGLQDKMAVLHQPTHKKTDVWNRRDSCDVCVRNGHKLEIELLKFNVTTVNLKTDINRLLAMNETCQSEISQLKKRLGVQCPPGSVQDVNTTSTSHVPMPATTSRLTVLTPVTTVRSEVEKHRILIAPFWSPNNHQFRQLNIHSNSLSAYQHLTMKGVSSVAYIAKTQKLLIGLTNPDKILSSTLDATYSAVVREGVRAIGMTVDEERGIVFMKTNVPSRTISRMSTQGKHFTVITDLSKYARWPAGITLDKKLKKIYACNGGKMFILTYDGQGLATLVTGSDIYTLILDQTAGVLYYNNGRKLMKMPVSSNVSAEVTTLDVIPWSMALYRGTIYYGSFSPVGVNSGSVGAVDVTRNVAYILKSVPMDKISGLHIQLIPTVSYFHHRNTEGFIRPACSIDCFVYCKSLV